MYKRYAVGVMAASLLLLLLYGSFVAVADPFAQYHLPLPMFPTVYTRGSQAYVNPGLAKNRAYNQVLIGSSVSENFYASDFDRAFGGTTLKLPFAGGTTMTYSNMLDTVFAHREIDTVFYSLDYFALNMDPAKPRYEMPMYLYDQNPFNDVSYLLNKEVLPYIAQTVSARAAGSAVTLDAAYNWEKENVFSEERVLKLYQRPETAAEAQAPFDAHYRQVEAGLQNITRHIRERPDTEFVLFYPPYSILWYDNYKRLGTLDSTVGGLARSMELLLQYGNVRIHSFAGWEEVITDLGNYRESMHFSEKINKRMVEAMAAGDFRVTRENLADMTRRLYLFVSAYDCDRYYR